MTSFRERVFQRFLKLRDVALVVTSLYSLLMFFVVCYLLHRSPTVGSKPETTVVGHRRFRSDKHSAEDDGEAIEATTPRPNKTDTGYFFLDSNQTFTKRCGRCSIVSSSGHLYLSGAGADIEAADCVIRMNTAPVTGYIEDVGIRTDIRIIGHVNLPRGLVQKRALREEILAEEDTRAKYIVVPWLYKESVNMKTHPVIKIARDFKEKYPEVEFVLLSKEKYEESEKRFKLETGFSRNEVRTWFSTGFVSMMFALDVCDKIHVYGLSTIEFCTRHPESKVPYHYYEPHKMTECAFQRSNELGLAKGHKFMTERAMFARWSLVYDITFHYPSWKATIQNATGNLDTPFLRKYKAALKTGKLDDVPNYIFKNGKRYRVIYRRVHKKPAIAAPKNDTVPRNETSLNAKSPDEIKAKEALNASLHVEPHAGNDTRIILRQVKSPNVEAKAPSAHAAHKRKKIIRKVVRKKT